VESTGGQSVPVTVRCFVFGGVDDDARPRKNRTHVWHGRVGLERKPPPNGLMLP